MVRGPRPLPHVTSVEVLHDFVVRLGFQDGFTREIDLEPELWGPMFEPLRDHEVFQQVKVDDELGTIVWPNGADLAPEFLYGEENLSRLRWADPGGARQRR
jgi:hypothetical protein